MLHMFRHSKGLQRNFYSCYKFQTILVVQRNQPWNVPDGVVDTKLWNFFFWSHLDQHFKKSLTFSTYTSKIQFPIEIHFSRHTLCYNLDSLSDKPKRIRRKPHQVHTSNDDVFINKKILILFNISITHSYLFRMSSSFDVKY